MQKETNMAVARRMTYTKLAYKLYDVTWKPSIARHAEKQQNLLLLLIDFIARFEISTECVF